MKNKVFVVNGFGHCGTTLIYLFAKQYYGSFGPSEMVNTINDLYTLGINRNCIFKTHTRYSEINEKNNDLKLKVLYLHGDIFNTVLSYANRHTINGKPICNELISEAKQNLNINDNSDKNFFDYDVFKFKEHFDNWNRPHTYEVLIVKYPQLYSKLSWVLDFLEIPKKDWENFPPYKKRKTDWKQQPADIKERLIKTYGITKEYLESMPDVIIPEVVDE